MSLRYSVDMRNAGLDARIACIGKGAVLRIFSGAAPASCAEADPAGLLVEIKLPTPWMARAQDGEAKKAGAWLGTAKGRGDARCFRICSADGKCHLQGGIPFEMALDNDSINVEQNVSVGTFVLGSGNG